MSRTGHRSPDSGFGQERLGDGMFLWTELSAVREVHGTELGERELLKIPRQLDALFLDEHV